MNWQALGLIMMCSATSFAEGNQAITAGSKPTPDNLTAM
jgi:hypothetical protein